MKAIMISIKPYWVCAIADEIKTVEVRKYALYKAIKKLIDEYGYALIYFYVTKDNIRENDNNALGRIFSYETALKVINSKGKVIASFKCEKVEEIYPNEDGFLNTISLTERMLLDKSFLSLNEMCDYFGDEAIQNEPVLGCAIYVPKLNIFYEPKELSEFQRLKKLPSCTRCLFRNSKCDLKNYLRCYEHTCYELVKIDKAPMTYCYVEVDE